MARAPLRVREQGPRRRPQDAGTVGHACMERMAGDVRPAFRWIKKWSNGVQLSWCFSVSSSYLRYGIAWCFTGGACPRSLDSIPPSPTRPSSSSSHPILSQYTRLYPAFKHGLHTNSTDASFHHSPFSALNLSQLSLRVLKTNPAINLTSVLASWGSLSG